MRPALLFFLTILTMTSSPAATLHICPGEGGPQVRLAEGAPKPGCSAATLPVPPQEVLSVYPLADASAASAATLLLYGRGAEGPFGISSVEAHGADGGTPGRSVFPDGRELLPQLAARPFGVEGRTEVSRDGDALVLRCAPGNRAAGVLLSAPWFMTRAQARLQWQAAGQGVFSLALADAAQSRREASVALGDVGAGEGQFALPHGAFDPAAWRHFVLACPPQGGALRLNSLQLLMEPATAPPRSTWVWSSAAWRSGAQQVLQHAQAHAIRTLFISVPVQRGAVKAPQELASFIRRAGAAGIAVWAVDGDPRMVLPGEQQEAAAALVKAYAAYNSAMPAGSRLAGAQFDVEHYLLPGYRAAAAQMDRHYGELAGALRAAAGTLPLDFVVPFWWDDKLPLLEALARSATSVTVMDYRTDPEQIAGFAQPFLDWGVRHGKQVRIALEAGTIGAERQRRYTRAAEGELWQVDAGGTPVLVLLRSARANPAGAAYRLQYERLLDGSATTFHGREAALLQLLPTLERRFSAWPSFGGMALHELR
ncbi:hypothetical protein [Pseudoduganella rhizocola]|uniref:hypothetical protein n=1 Tax=Pseudoduganella rhizocola TaxID=3382643 RepID=UPI0038B44CED